MKIKNTKIGFRLWFALKTANIKYKLKEKFYSEKPKIPSKIERFNKFIQRLKPKGKFANLVTIGEFIEGKKILSDQEIISNSGWINLLNEEFKKENL